MIEKAVRPPGLLEKLTHRDALEPIRKTVVNGNLLGRISIDPGAAVGYVTRKDPNAKLQVLAEQDELAYNEALNSGGLLLYRPGTFINADIIDHIDHTKKNPETAIDIFAHPDVTINFCFWRNAEDARIASGLPEHRKARALAFKYHAEYHVFAWDVARVGNELKFVPNRHNYYNKQDYELAA